MPLDTPPPMTLRDRLDVLSLTNREQADTARRLLEVPAGIERIRAAEQAIGERKADLDRYRRAYAETYGHAPDLGRLIDADELVDVLKRIAAGDPMDEARA